MIEGATIQSELREGIASIVTEIVDAVPDRRRKLADTPPTIILSGISDIACPDGLVYARKEDECVAFNAEVVFAPDFVLRLYASDFTDALSEKIDTGALYRAVSGANANTAIKGMGNPGDGVPIPSIAPLNEGPSVDPVTDEGLGTQYIVGITVGSLLIVIMILLVMAILKRKSDEEKEVREFAGEAALDEEDPPPPVKVTKDMSVEEVKGDEKSEERAMSPSLSESDDNSVSVESAGWSDGNDDTIETDTDFEDSPEKVTVASTLAAMGVASTVTCQLASS